MLGRSHKACLVWRLSYRARSSPCSGQRTSLPLWGVTNIASRGFLVLVLLPTFQPSWVMLMMAPLVSVAVKRLCSTCALRRQFLSYLRHQRPPEAKGMPSSWTQLSWPAWEQKSLCRSHRLSVRRSPHNLGPSLPTCRKGVSQCLQAGFRTSRSTHRKA